MNSPGLEARRAGRTVLVVDDDEDQRATLGAVLSCDGFRVVACSNGRQALDWLRTGRADLILLDLNMPVMDGWQFRVAQREHSDLASIPVIALSADPTAKAAAVDADAHLQKPADPRTLIDTIERLLLARERKDFQANLAQTDRLTSLGTLAAGVAHEINNPLTYLMLNVEYARAELARLLADPEREGTSQMRVALDRVGDGAERIRTIVRGMKTFSRPDDETVAPLQVGDVLEATLGMMENELRHSARLVKELESVPDVVANRARLGQVFLNLLLNAVQALPEEQSERNEIRVVVRSPGPGRVVVEVHDNGVGIPQHLHGRIFEPFFTTKPVGVGTGLGLAICHGIVTSLRGALSVESTAGHGSVFRVELPAAMMTAAVAIAPPVRVGGSTAPSPVAAAQGRILVVDDEPLVCSSLKRLLAGDGDVVAVTSATEALARIAAGERFDVVLCDVMMPGMDAVALHDALCAVAPQQAKQMIFMTGGAFTQRARDFLERVPNARLDKPFDVKELRALVQARLPVSAEDAPLTTR
jgi:signal transduction histidine kinase